MSDAPPGRRALGLRADARQIHWAVVETVDDQLVLVAKGEPGAPKEYRDPDALAWFRSRLHLLIGEYGPKVVAVRTPEPNARTLVESFRQRLRVEGVLMEAAAEKGIRVESAAYATIGSRMGTDKSRAKRYYTDGGDLRGLDLDDLNGPLREAVMVAAAMLGEE